MTDLSPQAQAVLDAFNREARPEPHHQREAIAAALRAAAKQVVPTTIDPRLSTVRSDLMRIAAELKGGAALAQPEPQGPTAAELRNLWDTCNSPSVFAHAVLARWGRPAVEPMPKQEDIHYAWELHDAEGEWQAGGSANSLEDVQREGNRYLQTYSQDGPHKLIIQQHRVTTIEPVPGVEVE